MQFYPLPSVGIDAVPTQLLRCLSLDGFCRSEKVFQIGFVYALPNYWHAKAGTRYVCAQFVISFFQYPYRVSYYGYRAC